MQLLTATLTKPARQVTTKYGERTVADVRLADGTETAIWRPANDQSLVNLTTGQAVTVAKDSKGKVNLTTGQAVTVAKDSKGKVNLIDSPPPAVAPTSITTQTTGINPDTKRAIAQYVQEQRDLLAFCLDQAATIPQAQTDESVEKLGVTLYLSAQRKFKLA